MKRKSVVDRLRQFFAANPDEELTYSGIAEKFGCSLWRARHVVRELKESGHLESVHVIRPRAKGIAHASDSNSRSGHVPMPLQPSSPAGVDADGIVGAEG